MKGLLRLGDVAPAGGVVGTTEVVYLAGLEGMTDIGRLM